MMHCVASTENTSSCFDHGQVNRLASGQKWGVLCLPRQRDRTQSQNIRGKCNPCN